MGTQNNFEKVGMFLAPEKQPSSAPRFTTHPPQLHHKITTAAHHIFQNHPQKHEQNRGFPARLPRPLFSWN
jgi:hypothetical protein